MKEEAEERVKEEEEERDAWMADPFPNVKLRDSKLHPSMEVEIEEEEEEEEEEEGEMFRIDALTFTGVAVEAEVNVSECSWSSPDV